MIQVSAGGKSVATDAAVLSMYQNLNAMQPQLLSQIDAIQQKKGEGVIGSERKGRGGICEIDVLYLYMYFVSSNETVIRLNALWLTSNNPEANLEVEQKLPQAIM